MEPGRDSCSTEREYEVERRPAAVWSGQDERRAIAHAALQDAQRKRIEQQHYIVVINEGRGAELPQVLENKGVEALRDRISDLKGQYQSGLATMKPTMPPVCIAACHGGSIVSTMSCVLMTASNEKRVLLPEPSRS